MAFVKLEYRLFPALLPAIVGLPLALGLFSTSLQKRLHCLWFALASFLMNLIVNALTTVVTNYYAEVFQGFASETVEKSDFYHLVLGLLVPFFVDAWKEHVGMGRSFSMMSFFSLACSLLLVLFI